MFTIKPDPFNPIEPRRFRVSGPGMHSEYQAYREIRLVPDDQDCPEGLTQKSRLLDIILRAYEAGKQARGKEIRQLLGLE